MYEHESHALEHCCVMRLVIERVPTSPGLGDRVDGVEYLSEDQAHTDRDRYL